MGQASKLPCDFDFSLRLEGELVSMSKLDLVFSTSGDRLVIVARRGLGGVVTATKSVAPLGPSEGNAGSVLSTPGAFTVTNADMEVLAFVGSIVAKISFAAKTLRGRREERVVLF